MSAAAPQPRARRGALTTLTPEDAPSSEPQPTPPADAGGGDFRRALDVGILELVRSAATTPVQMAQLSAELTGLRQVTERGFDELRQAYGRTEAILQRQVVLQEEANRQRADELRAREEAARWWRSLITPQGVLYLLVVLVTVLGALLGVGHMLPPPKVP